jgi:hypothetical protein
MRQVHAEGPSSIYPLDRVQVFLEFWGEKLKLGRAPQARTMCVLWLLVKFHIKQKQIAFPDTSVSIIF